jgi:hypothetical protein
MDVMMGPGQAIGRDSSKGEAVEHELDAFISRRGKQRRQTEGEQPALEVWMESERRYDEHRRQENRLAWREYHQDQAERHRRTLEGLIRHHEAQAARLCEEGAA